MRCSVCGCQLGCDADSGTIDKETGQVICDGCYTPELHPDLDAYDETDKTAGVVDIGECE